MVRKAKSAMQKARRDAPLAGSSPQLPPGAAASLSPAPFWRRNRLTILVLSAILVVAASLRMADLGQSPPGTLDDECVEIWNAYCLLKTGQDWHGERWPILSTRGLGDNRPTIFMYCLIPFQALFGMSIWSARFATACYGTLEVGLIFVVAARLFHSRNTGLMAAAMLALNPWHLRDSRYAFMANSFFITLPIALLLLANLPLRDARPRRPRPVLALLAGLVTGMCCYGYASIRLFLPLFLMAAVAVSWRGWWEMLKTRRGALAIAAAALGLAVTMGPLVYAHLATPERMAKRTQSIMIWQPNDSLGTKVEKAAARYLPHFGPDFLFVKGDGEDRRVVRRVPGTGAFQWYLMPPMAVGLGLLLWRLRSSRAARILLAGVVLYPMADLFFQAWGVHLYRSLPGLPMLILLSAFGAVAAGAWLWNHPGWPFRGPAVAERPKGPPPPRGQRQAFWAAAGGMALWAVVWSASFFPRFYGDYNRLPAYYRSFECEEVEAFDWLRPRMDQADAVFVSMDRYGIRSIYLIALVTLGYSPQDWFGAPKDYHYDALGGDLDWVSRFGKVWFGYSDYLRKEWKPKDANAPKVLPELLYDLPAWKQLQQNGRSDLVYLVVPPGYPLLSQPEAVHEVRRPDGAVVLWICRMRI